MSRRRERRNAISRVTLTYKTSYHRTVTTSDIRHLMVGCKRSNEKLLKASIFVNVDIQTFITNNFSFFCFINKAKKSFFNFNNFALKNNMKDIILFDWFPICKSTFTWFGSNFIWNRPRGHSARDTRGNVRVVVLTN